MANDKTQLKISAIRNETISRLTKAGYKDNWVHGLPHLERVRKNYRLLLRHAKVPPNIAKCLKIAVELHDIGRAFPGNHAKNSARIFKQMKIGNLSDREKNDIEFAVMNHNKGLLALGIIEPRENKEILLGLLCLVDHMDAIGKIGILRSYQWIMESQKHPRILSDWPLKRLKNYFQKNKITPEIRNSDLGEESAIGNLINSYLVTFEVIESIKKILNKRFLKIIASGQKELRQEIDFLIELAEENQVR